MLNILKKLPRCSILAIIVLVWTIGQPVESLENGKARNRLSAEEEAGGFKLLFNGRDLTGWKHNGEPGSFTVKDGMLVGDRTGKGHLAYWLSTEREYQDFELRLQYKISKGGNSGIFIRAPHEGRTSKMGMEIQIIDDYGSQGKPGAGNTGAIYRVVPPKALASKPAGQWNDLWVLCDGDRVKVTLNGEVIVDALMTDHEELILRPRKGYIGLSSHTQPTWFRNVRLREIVRKPASKPVSATTTTDSSDLMLKYTFVRDTYGTLIKAPGGQPVLGYVTKKQPDSKLTADSVCCFHPVYTPCGEVVTDFAPDDHRHHRGVFLAWYDMQGSKKADFWGWGKFAPTESRVIENHEIEVAAADQNGIELHIRNHWIADGEVMIREELRAAVGRRESANLVDLTYRLTPTTDVRLEQSAFGGFCVRARKAVRFTVHDADGEVLLPDPHYLKPETNWPAKDWYAYSIQLADNRTIGMAVIDHPDNPPSTWHNPRTVWVMNPCPTTAGPTTLKKDQPFVLRYRLVAYDGPPPTQLLQALAAEWRQR